MADPDLAGLLAGLVEGQWRGLCLFTGRLRWRALDEHLGRGEAAEVRLPALTARQAIMLMDNLPRLRREKHAAKIALFKKVGGHPKSIELLEGWLASGRVTDLLADPALDEMLAHEWEDYFLRALLAQLPPAEAQALTRLSIFRTRLDEEAFEYAGAGAEAVRRWLDLSLLQREAEAYSVHPVVGEYLLGRQAADEVRGLHAWAATYYGRPFIEMARQAVARSGKRFTEEEIEGLARGDPGVVGQTVHRTDDLAQARAAMAGALAWQGHLFAAGEHEAAGEIVTAVWQVLARWGERDRAKALLRGMIDTFEGPNKAVAQGNLATLLAQEGKLHEALAIHEAEQDVYRQFGANQPLAANLSDMSIIHQMRGDLDAAIGLQNESLSIRREIGDEEGLAVSLHQLSILYMLQEDYAAALARSEEAEALARKLKNDHFVAAMLHQQGLVLNRMARAERSEDKAAAHRRAAIERFQASLAIKRRIGNEAGVGKTLGELGKLLRDAGQMRQAIAAFNEALEIARKLGDPVSMGIRLEFLGSVHERQGQYPAALEKYRQALGILERVGAVREAENNRRHIARVRAKMKQT